jgi:hypothetical protein
MGNDQTTPQDKVIPKQASNGSLHMNVSQATLEPDWFLRKLVALANSFEIGTSITLLVGGVQVTGMLISGESYFKLTAEEFGGAFFDTGIGDKVKTILNGFAEAVKPDLNDLQHPDPTYIHLANTHFYNPSGPIPQNDGKPILWRARISSIDGFYIGSSAKALAPSKTDE